MLPARIPDLGVLDVVMSVARLGSMSAAGREHNLSQQAVSARVRTAEREIGIRIFDRTAQGVQLTGDGTAVLEWVAGILDSAGIFAAGVRSLLREDEAHVTVAASMTIAEHLVPSWIVTMRRRFPAVSTHLKLMNSAEVAAAVLGGSADIGFIEGPDVPSGLDVTVVASDELVVVAHPEHAWAIRGTVEPADLASTALIQREQGSGTRTTFMHALHDHGIDAVEEPLLELSSVTAIKAAVMSSGAPAVLSSLAVQTDIRDGRLVRVGVVGMAMPRTLKAVWDAKSPMRGARRDFLEIARSTAPELEVGQR